MNKSRQYRIKSPTVALLSAEGHSVTVTVPADALVTIIDDAPQGDRLVDVIWNGGKYLMFTQDLRDRAEPIEQTSPDPA